MANNNMAKYGQNQNTARFRFRFIASNKMYAGQTHQAADKGNKSKKRMSISYEVKKLRSE